MNTMIPGGELADTAVAPPSRRALASRRLPLRATGLLVILGVMVLAFGLGGSALLFRNEIQANLKALEQTLSRQDALMRERIGEQGGGRNPARLDQPEQQLRQAGSDRAQHLAGVRQLIDGGTLTILCLAWLGITSAGALALLFFSRLADDIGAVRARALAIVVGDRSRGRPLVRNDELGDLAHAVDSLAEALARRERDLEIERRHVMHQEKLATIGSMAAGVLREIGNPIAAIDGYARAIVDAQRAEAAHAASWPEPRQMLHETARLVAITHGIAELAEAPASRWQLASLNEIVTQSIALLRYEPRLEGVAVASVLDPQLPAATVVADRLVLLLINLVINAADATASLAPRTGRIELATRCADAGVELCVSDNGCGMSDAVRQRAFEPLFTTKPAGHGTGLGLPLCRSIVQDHGGRIELESAPGKGTRINVWLPLSPAGAVTLA
ncbi:MAG TPA: ATP-binding protein [Ramlibacter sp.]|nr:ATP-binding protein [Ramlibacter sp.]